MSEHALLRRFTVALLLTLLVPAALSIVYLNIATLPAGHENLAQIPGWSIGYFCASAGLIVVRLRRLLVRQVAALSDGRPTDFRWLRRLTNEGVVAVVLYVTGGLLAIGFEASRAGGNETLPLAVIVGIEVTMVAYILIPAFLYLQDLFGRFFGRYAEGRSLVGVRMRILVVGLGNSFVACTSFLLVQSAFAGTVTVSAWIVWASILLYAGAMSYIAYAGFAASVAPLEEALENHSNDGRLLQPRSIDEVGALIHRLKALLDNRASVQRELRNSEAKTRMFADAASDIFFEMDADLRFSFMSDRFRVITGFDPSVVIGQLAIDMRQQFEPDEPNANQDLLAHRPYRNYRFSVPGAQGKLLHFQTSAVPYFDEHGKFCGYRGAGTNVTDIVEAQNALRVNQAELAQAQKMEAVGQLTGGMAHDFNNLLTVILGNLELLVVHASDQPKLLRHIQTAMTAAARGGALTQRLLAFSRRQSLRPVEVDVGKLLHGMEELLQRTLGEDIRIDVSAQQGLWRCMVDPHQLESAILNLALNARDAMPLGGRLSMELANCGSVSGIGPDGDGPNDYVRLRIADTGHGIAADVLPHVFEPFFTTKGPGEGSGLGLSMVYGFINQSGGSVVLNSAPDKGTTAEILLPRVLEGEHVVNLPISRTAVAGHGQTVLVIEDDPGVTTVILEGLGQLGYRVINVATGEEALACFGDLGRVDLVLSDIVLPGGLSGLDVEQAIQQRYPEVRFVFMSGYAQDEIARKGARLSNPLRDLDILRKPFQLTDLADRVIEALAADAQVSGDG